MSCPGLHCAGCAGGAAVPVVPLVAFLGLAWVAEHLVEVAIVSAACSALAVAAVVALMRWQERREARRAAGGQLWSVREVPQIPHVRAESVTSAERPALGFRDLHIHIDGVPSAEQAAVIRQALNGRTGSHDPHHHRCALLERETVIEALAEGPAGH